MEQTLEFLGIAASEIPVRTRLWRSSLGVIYGFDELPEVDHVFVESLSLRSTGAISRRDNVWLNSDTGEVFGKPNLHRASTRPETWRDRPALF